MRLLLLIVGTVLLPQANALKCYGCSLSSAGTCTDTVTQCAASNYQCAVIQMAVYAGGSKQYNITGKSCVLPEECLMGSVNFGSVRTVVNSSCCTTDLCNNQPAPDISTAGPNGKKCFTCNNQTQQCTTTLNCEGTEDHCVTAAVTVGGGKTTVKGCASKQFCSSLQTTSGMESIGTEISCCQSDYCNSGSSTSAGVLLLVAPLTYFTVFS